MHVCSLHQAIQLFSAYVEREAMPSGNIGIIILKMSACTNYKGPLLSKLHVKQWY